MFGFLRQESRPLQLYGKLPLAKDYLRIGCSTDGGLALREFLDRGFSPAAEREAPELPWPARFVIGEHWGSPLMGLAWPSSDTGGLRRFPFVLFVERKRKPLLVDLEQGLEVGAGLWHKLAGFYHAHGNYSDGQGLLAAMRGQALQIDALEGRPVPRSSFPSWLEALWPGQGQSGLQAVIDELDRLQRESPGTPIRLPLVVDQPLRAQVHAWCKLLAAVGVLEPAQVPTMFFPDVSASDPAFEDEPAWLAVFRRAPGPEDAAWLASAKTPGDRPGDLLDGEVHRAGRHSPAPENAPTLADSLRGALASFRGRSAPR